MDDTGTPTTERQNGHVSPSEKGSSAATSELIDELSALDLQTDYGWYEAEVTQVTPTAEGDLIAVTIVVPTGKTVIWHLEKPEIWTDEYLFVRLAEQYDYGAGAIDLLKGETLYIRPKTGASVAILDTTGTWEIHDPARSKMYSRVRARSELLYSCLSSWPEFLYDFAFNLYTGLIGFGLLLFLPVGILITLIPEGPAKQAIILVCLLLWVSISVFGALESMYS